MSLITPIATLSFPSLFAARKVVASDEGEVPKFSAALIFSEEAQATPMYAALKAAAVAAATETFGADAQQMLVDGRLKWPFLDGPKAMAPAGTTVLRVRSVQAPGVVSLIPDPTTGRPMPITDPSEMYAGAQVRASLGVFTYSKPNKGVSFGLNNIQKVGDGDRLDGRVPAADEFSADASMVADLSAMDTPGTEGGEAPAETPGNALSQLL